MGDGTTKRCRLCMDTLFALLGFAGMSSAGLRGAAESVGGPWPGGPSVLFSEGGSRGTQDVQVFHHAAGQTVASLAAAGTGSRGCRLHLPLYASRGLHVGCREGCECGRHHAIGGLAKWGS